jgi:hypothetical protein
LPASACVGEFCTGAALHLCEATLPVCACIEEHAKDVNIHALDR